MKKYFVYNLGCRVNSYELVVIENHLQDLNYIEGDKNDTDLNLIVINTCSVTHVSDQKSRKMIRHFRLNNPQARILVMGCFVEGTLDFDYSMVDVYVGTKDRQKIIEAIDDFDFKYEYDRKTEAIIYEEFGLAKRQNRKIPEIKIEDGCNNFCTYCKVCYLRGRVRSRLKEYIFLEIASLISQDKDTFILVGINLGEYGLDLNGYRLVDLLKDIYQKFPKIKIILSSLELSTLSDALLEYIQSNPLISRHFHIPLQSGSARILTLMNRHYQKVDYLSKIDKIKKMMPESSFSADIIVGFPGETEEDFLDTVDVVRKVGFNHIHIFPYSKREGTIAARMSPQVSPQTKKERFAVLNSFNINKTND